MRGVLLVLFPRFMRKLKFILLFINCGCGGKRITNPEMLTSPFEREISRIQGCSLVRLNERFHKSKDICSMRSNIIQKQFVSIQQMFDKIRI